MKHERENGKKSEKKSSLTWILKKIVSNEWTNAAGREESSKIKDQRKLTEMKWTKWENAAVALVADVRSYETASKTVFFLSFLSFLPFIYLEEGLLMWQKYSRCRRNRKKATTKSRQQQERQQRNNIEWNVWEVEKKCDAIYKK